MKETVLVWYDGHQFITLLQIASRDCLDSFGVIRFSKVNSFIETKSKVYRFVPRSRPEISQGYHLCQNITMEEFERMFLS